MQIRAQSFEGIDVAWLASDSKGQVAAFVTGGSGPVPAMAVPSLEDAEDQALALPDVSGLRLHVHVQRPDDFIALAKKGLFVYDWPHPGVERQTHGVYRLAASPNSPIVLSETPLLACLVHFPTVVFGTMEVGVVA
jgi:hypothetical protein